ncbi:MAG: DNA-processing protein DprA [Patescibacteria group bacterium]|nr:DNA-processing protein DprA [Patescibacteria group bacterium]
MSYQYSDGSVNRSIAWDDGRLGFLLLASFDGFGSRTLNKLNKYFHADGKRAMEAGVDKLVSLGVTQKAAEKFSAFREETEISVLSHVLDKEDITFVTINDAAYPPQLKHIHDPPFALFIRGIPEWREKNIAIVGTRRMTSYGRHVAADIARDLACAGVGIVSGLALGVDTVALESANAFGHAVAVLGSGVDDVTIYPRANFHLAQNMIKSGGVVMSEFPPLTLGLKHHFPLRNRIISGLCQATVVVEAAEGSGSLITANSALEQNRDVFSVPGPITSPQSQGTNKLLKMGAFPCTGATDVLEQLSLPAAEALSHHPVKLTERQISLLGILDIPLHVDDISRQLKLDTGSVSAEVMALELAGLASSTGGKIYVRTPASLLYIG